MRPSFLLSTVFVLLLLASPRGDLYSGTITGLPVKNENLEIKQPMEVKDVKF
jgi:hypothetical protein